MNYNNPYNMNMGMSDAMNMQSMGYTSNTGCGANMTMPTTGYPTNMGYMPGYGMNDGFGCGQMMPPVLPGCNQVVQKCFVEEMPYYVGYNTHVVNNVVRRHIQIPVYSQSQETVYMDEWQTGCGCNR